MEQITKEQWLEELARLCGNASPENVEGYYSLQELKEKTGKSAYVIALGLRRAKEEGRLSAKKRQEYSISGGVVRVPVYHVKAKEGQSDDTRRVLGDSGQERQRDAVPGKPGKKRKRC